MTQPKIRIPLLSLFLLIVTFAFPAAAWGTGPDPAETGVISGTVTATHIAGRYTYIQLRQDPDKKEVWLAAGISASVGDRIEYRGGVPMRNFHSEALDRTFDEVLFVSAIHKQGDETKPAGNEKASVPDDDFHRTLAPGQPDVVLPTAAQIKRSAAEKPIAEIFAGLDALNGKTIGLKAKVIKVGANILGKNWITLSDGTGNAPDDKLLATTNQQVKVGSTLSVTGIIRTNVDLGSGYKYKAVLEEAVFIP